VPSSYAQVPYLERFFGEDLKFLESPAAGVQAVKNGQLDSYYATNALLQIVDPEDPDVKMAEVNPGDFGLPAELTGVPEGSFVSCDNPELLDAYNTFYERVSQTEEYKREWRRAWGETSAPKDTVDEKMVLDYKSPPDRC
jgi:hypothetical protein